MKAQRCNIVNSNRAKLEEVIPLSTPFTIAIDPCNLCNFKCEFCAMQVTKEPQNYKKQVMKYELFTKIIDDISDFPDKLKILRLNGQGEPLLNKDFCKMVRYAKEKGVADWIETITNGSCLCPELNEKLVASGINRIRISIEAKDEAGYMEMSHYRIRYDEFINNIRDLYERSRGKCEIYIKIVDAAVPTEEDKEKFYALYENICDRIFIDRVIPLWSDFEEIAKFDINKATGVHGQKVKKIKVCPFPFYSFIINPEGEVTACCADWKRKLVWGNVSEDCLLNIWNGEIVKQFWIDLLKGNKNKYEMCAKCLLPMFDCNDDIDQYAEEILKRVEE